MTDLPASLDPDAWGCDAPPALVGTPHHPEQVIAGRRLHPVTMAQFSRANPNDREDLAILGATRFSETPGARARALLLMASAGHIARHALAEVKMICGVSEVSK